MRFNEPIIEEETWNGDSGSVKLNRVHFDHLWLKNRNLKFWNDFRNENVPFRNNESISWRELIEIGRNEIEIKLKFGVKMKPWSQFQVIWSQDFWYKDETAAKFNRYETEIWIRRWNLGSKWSNAAKFRRICVKFEVEMSYSSEIGQKFR